MFLPSRYYDSNILITESEIVEILWLENDVIEGIEEDMAKQRLLQLKNKSTSIKNFHSDFVNYNFVFKLSMSYFDINESNKIIDYISNIANIIFFETNKELTINKIKIHFYVLNSLFSENNVYGVITKISNDLIKEVGFLYPDFQISF
jgi:hypothetical protein